MANKKDLLNNNTMTDYIIGKRNIQETSNEKKEAIQEVVDVNNLNNFEEVNKKYHEEAKKIEPKYRFNLSIDNELGKYVKNVAWEERKSINKFIEDVLRESMKRYIKRGGNKDKWID